MIPGYDPAAAGAAAVFDQRHGERRTTDSTKLVARPCGGRDLPARRRSTRRRGRFMLKEQPEPIAIARSQRQAARRREIDASTIRDFCDHRRNRPALERFLKRPQCIDDAWHVHDHKRRQRQSEGLRAIECPDFSSGEVMLDPDCLLPVLVRESRDGPGETGHCAMIQRTGGMQFVDGAQSQPATERDVDHRRAERQPTSLMVRPCKHPTQIEKRRDGSHSSSCSWFVLYGFRVFG